MTIPALQPTPSATLQKKLADGTPINILTIDGGALRGIVPATLLSFLDGSYGNIADFSGSNISSDGIKPPSGPTVGVSTGSKSLAECFDLIVGTSAGGLLTVGMTVPKLNGDTCQAADLVNLFYNQGSTIFPMPSAPVDPLLLSGPMFNNTGLIKTIAGAPANQSANVDGWGSPSSLAVNNLSTSSYYDGAFNTLNQAATSVMISTFNNGSSPSAGATTNQIDASTPWGPLFINNDTTLAGSTTENPLYVSALQACLMTSAFPMLLPPVPYDLNFTGASEQDNYFLDGGVWAGNPALATYMWAVSNGFKIGTMISLGCGQPPSAITAPGYTTAQAYGAGVAWALVQSLPKGAAEVVNGAFKLANISTEPGWLMTARQSSAAKTGSSNNTVNYISDEGELSSLLSEGAADWTMQFLTSAIAQQKTPGNFYRIDPELSTGLPAYCSSQESALQSWITSAASALLENSGGTYSLSSTWKSIIAALNPAS
ncbi:patatin-like phospholipase family protein [Nitrospirillum pindoramense]|uniref:Patatin-like phospholipase n=1 Tax=Nitrospirillum amazonense TaxID=28077 RepID=A0A560GNC1_9PROT|nr:patatin-like phospholipase family protein [Nitrospirillum amazonense]TWB35169.1 patatin-like phospholipase [Nitrospirillum amazonense]